MLSGHSTNLPKDILLDTGIVMVGATKWGATRGAPSFKNGKTLQNVEFDGKQSPIKGLDRFFYDEAEISFTMIELGDASTGAQMAKIEPGMATADTGTTPSRITTITPKVGGGFVASGDYLTNVYLVFERGEGQAVQKSYFAIQIPCGLVSQYGPIQGASKGEATIPVSVVARKDMASGTVADATYKFLYLESLPAS